MYDNYNFPVGSDTPDAPWNDSLEELYPTMTNTKKTRK